MFLGALSVVRKTHAQLALVYMSLKRQENQAAEHDATYAKIAQNKGRMNL